MGATTSDQRHIIHVQQAPHSLGRFRFSDSDTDTHTDTHSDTHSERDRDRLSSVPAVSATTVTASSIPTNMNQTRSGQLKRTSSFDISPATSTTRHVGLENKAGANNCFLNATLQALWHLDLFREKVLYDEQVGGGEDNIDLIFSPEDSSVDTLSALCALFAQYMYTEYSCIPSTELRREIYYFGNCKPFSP